MKKKNWTRKEINILKSGFVAGKLVKILALEIGRSTTAVNKFLSRSGIRTRRWSIHKKPLGSSEIFEVTQRNLAKGYNSEIEVGLEEVVHYLRMRGLRILENKIDCNLSHENDKYMLKDIPISDVKLLLLANRLRLEKGEPIFSVPSLTY
ncbi:MAG: hypothetical protein LBI95_04365 [Holosporales bacterium]|jgi:hypothetical protein|nr:hypothetical protein [Holosporales bacterium]